MMIRLLDIAAIADECKGKPITYHEDGSLASKTDKRGFTWSYVYDSLGNLVRAIDHLGNETLLSYDGAGNITVTEDPLGNVTTYDFDAMNRLTCRTDAQGTTTSYTYQRCNLCNAQADLVQTVEDAYDDLVRPVAQHLTDRELSSAWDPEGNLVRSGRPHLDHSLRVRRPRSPHRTVWIPSPAFVVRLVHNSVKQCRNDSSQGSVLFLYIDLKSWPGCILQ